MEYPLLRETPVAFSGKKRMITRKPITTICVSWMLDSHLSAFLMRSVCDVLSCGEYDTAARVLEKMGWTVDEAYQEDFPALDMDALLKQRSEYGADAVCGCAYDEDKHLLIAAKIDRADSRNSRMMTYQKQ